MRDFLILRENQRFVLNRLLLLIAVVLYIFSTEIANYGTTVNEAWFRWKNILMFDLTLIVFALRSEIKKLVTKVGFEIIIFILINYFIDQFFGLKGWSWNDYITIGLVVVDFLKYKLKKTNK